MDKKEQKKKEIDQIFENVIDQTEPKLLGGMKNSEVRKVLDQLKQLVDVRRNVITFKIELKFKEEKEFRKIRNWDLKTLNTIIRSRKGLSKCTKDKIDDILCSPYMAINYDPMHEYLMGLPKWDGTTPFIEKYLEQIELDDESNREHLIDSFKRWMVGMVASFANPKIVNQLCFILTGKQGRLKTTFLNNLVPEEYQTDYLYNGIYQTRDKEHETFLGIKWLINLDELATLNRSDIESLKSRLSQSQIEVRRPFERHPENFIRRATFCGSINGDEFLTDLTGNRRFLVFKVENIKFNDAIDIKNVYSQALGLYKAGFKYWFDTDEIELIESHNDPFRKRTLIEEYIMRMWEKPTPEEIEEKDPFVQYLSSSDIMAKINEKYPRLNANNTYVNDIGKVLSANEFRQKFIKIRGYKSNKRAWIVKKILLDDDPQIDYGEKGAENDENII